MVANETKSWWHQGVLALTPGVWRFTFEFSCIAFGTHPSRVLECAQEQEQECYAMLLHKLRVYLSQFPILLLKTRALNPQNPRVFSRFCDSAFSSRRVLSGGVDTEDATSCLCWEEVVVMTTKAANLEVCVCPRMQECSSFVLSSHYVTLSKS